jgi:hypothetical protein
MYLYTGKISIQRQACHTLIEGHVTFQSDRNASDATKRHTCKRHVYMLDALCLTVWHLFDTVHSSSGPLPAGDPCLHGPITSTVAPHLCQW